MGTRKRLSRKSSCGTKPRARPPAFRALADGLYELRIGARVVLELLVTLDGELMTFIRIDGALLGELPVLGEA
jgi:hypothetical protein